MHCRGHYFSGHIPFAALDLPLDFHSPTSLVIVWAHVDIQRIESLVGVVGVLGVVDVLGIVVAVAAKTFAAADNRMQLLDWLLQASNFRLHQVATEHHLGHSIFPVDRLVVNMVDAGSLLLAFPLLVANQRVSRLDRSTEVLLDKRAVLVSAVLVLVVARIPYAFDNRLRRVMEIVRQQVEVLCQNQLSLESICAEQALSEGALVRKRRHT